MASPLFAEDFGFSETARSLGVFKGSQGPGGTFFSEEQTLSLNRNEKAAVVADVAAQVARSQTLALAEYRGLTVEHMN